MQTHTRTSIKQFYQHSAIILTSTVLLTLPSFASAEITLDNTQKVSVEYMTGTADMHGVRIAYRPNITHQFDLPVVGETSIEWEGSLNLFDLHGSAKNEATYGISISPVLMTAIPSVSENYPLHAEFGIGVAYVHRKKFGGVNIGSYYQFEDRIGVVMDIDKNKQLALRYIHYSNGGLNTKNPGLDFLSLAYVHSF
ncbi:MAG: acyloxyacyl hydrolase [Glaciecola sp.]